MTRTRRLTKVVQGYDKKLVARRNKDGLIGIYRKTDKLEWHDFGHFRILAAIPDYWLVFNLTHDWSARGTPADWGIEPIIHRLHALDLWKDFTVSDRYELEYDKRREGKLRDFENSTESFLRDFRRQFAKATDDIRVANMDTKFDRRRIDDGYRK